MGHKSKVDMMNLAEMNSGLWLCIGIINHNGVVEWGGRCAAEYITDGNLKDDGVKCCDQEHV